MARKKKEDENADNASAAAFASAKDAFKNDVSPPGTKTRSTRKKRERSKDAPEAAKDPVEEEETKSQSPPRKKKARLLRKTDQHNDNNDNNNDNNDNSDDDDDDEMTSSQEEGQESDEEMEDESDNIKMPAAVAAATIETNGSAAHATSAAAESATTAATTTDTAAAAAISQRVPPVDKLRMPSMHTPGNLKETAVLTSKPSALAATSTASDEVPPPSRRLVFDKPSTATTTSTSKTDTAPVSHIVDENSILLNGGVAEHAAAAERQEAFQVRVYRFVSQGLESVVQVTTQLVAPTTVVAAATAADGEDVEPAMGERDDAKPSSLLFRFLKKEWIAQPWFWFVLILVLQAVFWPFWIHPILSTVVDGSKILLPIYKEFAAGSSSVTLVPTLDVPNATVLSAVPNAATLEAVASLKQTQSEKLAELTIAQQRLAKSRASLADAVDLLQENTDTLGKTATRQRSIIKPKQADLAKADTVLQELLTQEQVALSPLLTRIRAYLGDAEDWLLDLRPFEFMDIPEGKGCDGNFDANIVDLGELAEAVSDAQKEADEDGADMIRDPEMLEYVREWVYKSPPVQEAAAAAKPAKRRTGGSSLSAVRKAIETQIAIERADHSGLPDFAAVHNGASVIRTGDRATSPALVDNLPILNRLASLLSLRFYGYGADAALTPTFPRDALGQCWAFEKTIDKVSSFGTLTIRLAKPIYVSSITIEHPPKEVTDRVNTAIRSFRVFGFESPYAEGKPWPIGDFEYMLGEASMQQFEVDDEIGGAYVPKLKSISIAIDSNWGMTYACLYRLRVHGDEEL